MISNYLKLMRPIDPHYKKKKEAVLPPLPMLLYVVAILILLHDYIQIVVRIGFPDAVTVCFILKVSFTLFGGVGPCTCHSYYSKHNEDKTLHSIVILSMDRRCEVLNRKEKRAESRSSPPSGVIRCPGQQSPSCLHLSCRA